MPTLLFPDRDSLRLALTSNVVPATVGASPVRRGVDEDGRLLLAPDAALSRETLAGLMRLGVRILGPDAIGLTDTVDSWQQLFSLEPVSFNALSMNGPVMFEVPASRFGALAGEIRRLGSAPIAFRWLGDPSYESDDDDTILIRVES